MDFFSSQIEIFPFAQRWMEFIVTLQSTNILFSPLGRIATFEVTSSSATAEEEEEGETAEVETEVEAKAESIARFGCSFQNSSYPPFLLDFPLLDKVFVAPWHSDPMLSSLSPFDDDGRREEKLYCGK